MPNFTYSLDELCYVWRRTKFDIEADTKEDADAKIQTMGIYSVREQVINDDEATSTTELLLDTIDTVGADDLTPSNVLEIIDSNGDTVAQEWEPRKAGNGFGTFPPTN